MISYINENVDIKTIYSVEFIPNEFVLKQIEEGKHPAPWELYKVIKTDNIEKAITSFLNVYVDDNKYDVKIFEQILLNGEVVREQWIQKITGYNALVTAESRNIREHSIKMQDNVDMLSKENKKLYAFIKEYHADDIWKTFREEWGIKL